MGVDRSVRTGKTLFKSISRSKGEGVGECCGGEGRGDLTTAVEAEENGLPLRLLRRRARLCIRSCACAGGREGGGGGGGRNEFYTSRKS